MMKYFSLLFALLCATQTARACGGNDQTSEWEYNKLVNCTSWQCKQLWEKKWPLCLSAARATAIKERDQKRLAQQLKEDAEVSATQALNHKAAGEKQSPVELTQEEQAQVVQTAREALKAQLSGERCFHTPCGARLSIGI